MEVRKPTEEESAVFHEWSKQDRIEERTCRPIVDGKVVHAPHDPETLICFSEEIPEPIGRFSYFDYNPRNRSCEVGYYINPQFREKGFGQKMVRECVEFLFADTNLNLNKIYCQTGEFNTASVKLLENLGFHKDATIREHHELDGKLLDDFVFSVLRSEWED